MKDFKPLALADRDVFREKLSEDPPFISELTFTNLWMWRHRYNPVWSLWDDLLLVVLQPEGCERFALPPVGKGDKAAALAHLCDALQNDAVDAVVARASREFVEAWVDTERFEVVEDPDNSDYIYLTDKLITLSGNKLHSKKNHLNQFLKSYEFEYRKLDDRLAEEFLQLQESWCEIRDCEANPGLHYENLAVYEAIKHHNELDLKGGAIVIDAKVEAFSLGERLNDETAVIHVEKANPDIRGLYVAINQRFCQEEWPHVTYINREQDMGVEGLRKAKQSYNPHHMIDKFIIRPKN